MWGPGVDFSISTGQNITKITPNKTDFGEASTKFQPQMLIRILNTMERPVSYGMNTKISILKNKILMVESTNTIAYMSPVTYMSDGDVKDEEGAPEVN